MRVKAAKFVSKLLAVTQHRPYGLLIVGVSLLVATGATYYGGGAKTVYPHIFYGAIIGATIFYGFVGGTITALLAGLLVGPVMPFDVVANVPQSAGSWLFRMTVFVVVGALNGAVLVTLRRNLRNIEQLHKQSEVQEHRLEELNVRIREELEKRAEAEERMRREATRSGVLLRVAKRFNDHLHLQATLDAICEESADALGVPSSSVSLYNEESGNFELVATFGLPPEFRRRFLPYTIAAIDDTGSALQVFSTPDEIAGLSNGLLYQHFDVQTVVAVTLRYHRKFVGRIHAYAIGEPRTFDTHTLALFTGIANQAVRAIVNAQLLSEANSRLARLRTLRDIDKTITAGSTLQRTLTMILDQVIRHLRVDAADILLLDETSQSLEFVAGRVSYGDAETPSSSEQHHRMLEELPRRPRADGAGRVEMSDLAERPQSLENAGYATYHAVPLTAKGETKGVLEIFHREKVTPDHEWLEFLEALAGQAAIAIENVALFEETSRATQEVRHAYDTVIEGWARTLALRDIETIDHTRRVTQMTVALARETGMSGEDIVHARRGAILHDIGKIGIPDEILLKPGPLTEQEQRIMRKHPVYAYELLEPIEFLKPARHIPYSHHEWWNGSGYPQGLEGTDIPKAARIFTVIDVFDALTSNRPYRRAWSVDQALAYIKEQSGHIFDPEIAALFLEMAPVLMQRKHHHK